MKPLLRIQGASKRFEQTLALDNASLELHAGEVHALMGENGAGKSTLIKVLAGVVKAEAITISLNGQEVHIRSAQDASALGLRFIHQELNVIPQLSVAENLFLGRDYPQRVCGLINWSALHRQARQALARLEIDHIAPAQPMGRLGSGDKMLISIAAAFVNQQQAASIYVLDEPTAALNATEAARLFKLIAELRAQGCAILYVSHRLDEVLSLCERITVMRDGQTVACQKTAELTAAEIIQLMTGRTLSSSYPPRTLGKAATTMLEVNKLSSASLTDISLQVEQGEIVGLAGLADAGQSELLEALFGLHQRHSGEIKLDGQTLPAYGPSQAWSLGLAYVPRERRAQGLMLSRSIRDNMLLPHLAAYAVCSFFVQPGRERRQVKDLASRVRLKASGSEQACYQLSGGNQQKLVFARAVAAKPKLLLLDEPTRGVDIAAKYDIYSLIRQLSHQGTAVMVASSDLAELIGICDRIVVIKDQRQLTTVSSQGLAQQQLLQLCYGQTQARPSP